MPRAIHRFATLTALLACFAASPVVFAQAEGYGDHYGVILFEDERYGGASLALDRDVPDLSRTPFGSNRLSSIRVVEGCMALLYSEPHYRGAYSVARGDAITLRGSSVGNDTVSSIHVRCLTRPVEPPVDTTPYGLENGVQVFVDTGFRGQNEVFVRDDRDLRDNTIRSDRASSLRIAPGCKAVLFEDSGFRGRWVEVNDDVADLGRTALGNNQLSSIKVECRSVRISRGVQLFDEPGFRGASETIERDDRDLRDNKIGNDRVSSLRVSRGCLAVLFEDTDFRGRWIELDGEHAALAATALGDNRLSSIKVECEGHGGGTVGPPPGNPPRPPHDMRGANVYQLRNYLGRNEMITRDDPDLRDNRIGLNAMSSVRVSRGCDLIVFEKPNYQGRAMVLSADLPTLEKTRLGNGNSGSFMVRCWAP